MKKLFLICFLLIAFAVNAFSAPINVSTGVTSTGAALAPFTIDPHWTITSGPYLPSTTAKVAAHYNGFWEPTPFSTTNAGWINNNGAYWQNLPAFYTFERSFEVKPKQCSFS